MVVSDSYTSRVYTEVADDGDTLVIRVSGNFDFNMHREFQRAYRNVSPPPKAVIVDLSTTEHLDSAALGMLLLLRDYCVEVGRDGDEPRVELINANSHVSHILSVSNFDRIFSIR
ncbi:STAS domain-containing protein [Microbulbifer celer]|uniref:STAS domain-containing protein n=2 Tax=Microbulbifer TaxID=48073 RepID=A0ABW3UBA2_9GAMM|nr:STAS domain-containing protein [Microbulbifer celer]UFN59109.1 STAS domain-containing protein [Microbulbifer celer]